MTPVVRGRGQQGLPGQAELVWVSLSFLRGQVLLLKLPFKITVKQDSERCSD